MNSIAVKVINKREEALDIVSFELARVDGKPLPPFSAGSHVDVQVRPDLVRQYSLCNDPGERHRYLIAVLRDPGSRGGSVAMHDDVQAGDELTISEPKNHFPLTHAGHTLLLAGGIGVTPLLCMAERMAQTDADFSMHYCARSPERTAFRERIAGSSFAGRVQFHYDDGDAQQKLDLPALLANPSADRALYVCGPKGFIDFVVNSAAAAGWASANVHVEYFGAAVQASEDDGAFQVKLASSGSVYTIPADKTVVNVLRENGVEIPFSCEQGVCGTCIVRVLEGEPDHRDLFLTEEEQEANDQFAPCCSRSKSKMLVLDL